MIEQAVEKLMNEMTQHANQPYVQVVGQYLLKHLEAKPEHADNLLAEDKTILKSLDVMRRFAERKRVGNVAVLTDEEGFAVVLQYFGCWEGEPIELPPEPERRPVINRPLSQQNVQPNATHKRATGSNRTVNNTDAMQISLFETAELN